MGAPSRVPSSSLVMNGQQVADALGYPVAEVYRLVRAGELTPPIGSLWREKSPRRWRWSRKRFEADTVRMTERVAS